jgi:hypothetical protein
MVGSAVAASVAAAGCGETVIDTAKAERFISKTVGEQAGVRVKSVVCPKDVKAKKGDTFRCIVTGRDGTKGSVVVAQQDDKGNVHVSAPFLHTREAEVSIAEQIKKQTKAVVSVTCPEIVLPVKDSKFRCQGTDGNQTRPITATMTDASGNFRFKVE